ncbi:MAG TPA: hypothetical protein VN703_02865 [Candidatus Sulfopaludibacter sp.]|nr:hypothetical protein [Candidatus Sulfopaludibacter sp.]
METLNIKYYWVKFINQSKDEAVRIVAASEKHAKKIFAKQMGIEPSSYIVIVRKIH